MFWEFRGLAVRKVRIGFLGIRARLNFVLGFEVVTKPRRLHSLHCFLVRVLGVGVVGDLDEARPARVGLSSS